MVLACPPEPAMQIVAIQILRAIAAISVSIGHAQAFIAIPMERQGQVFGWSFLLPWAPASISSSSFPVSIMVYPSNRLFAKPGGAKIFAWRRLSRIVPLYWCAMALLLVKMPVLHKPMPMLRVSSPRFLHSLGNAGHRRAAPDLQSRLDAELRDVLLYRFALCIGLRLEIAIRQNSATRPAGDIGTTSQRA